MFLILLHQKQAELRENGGSGTLVEGVGEQ